MSEVSIPVDLFNPGQVFACLGLLEMADQMLGCAQGAFVWSSDAKPRFRISTAGEECPVKHALNFLRNAVVTSRSPTNSSLSTEKWNASTTWIDTGKEPFPFPLPDSPATLPARLSFGDNHIDIIHWGDNRVTSGRDNVKYWAGAGGYPGAALAQDALALIKAMPENTFVDPFNASDRQSSSFRFDWRRDYVPLDIGFSLNAHSSERFCTVGYPIVELLAAIGLTNARPKRISKLEYRYGVISGGDDNRLLDPIFLRASLGASLLPFTQRTFKMNLGWPGKENQARCITTVEEISLT